MDGILERALENKTTPGGLPAGDAERAAALGRMKLIATGMLVAMAVLFAVSYALQEEYSWLQYVRAAAEGGMVGALADWFAVTALFKHPLGLKIPHTAIIERKKDQIGASLGSFVEENFLSESVVEQKLESLQIARRLGGWLRSQEHAEVVAKEGATALGAALEVLNDADVQRVIEALARKHILEPQWSTTLGSFAERLLKDGHHHQLIDVLLDRADGWIRDNRSTITRMVSERAPGWVPHFVDELVGEKVYLELSKFVAAVRQDPDHKVRRSLDAYLVGMAADMQHDPEMIARVEQFKHQVLGDPQLQDIAGRAWSTLKTALLEAVHDPRSELRRAFVRGLRDLGTRLGSDAALGAKVDGWLAGTAGYLVRTYRSQIAGVISETVQRWDAAETSRKIELQIGKDLQYIRINGTVVGSLAGLAIFSLAHAFLG